MSSWPYPAEHVSDLPVLPPDLPTNASPPPSTSTPRPSSRRYVAFDQKPATCQPPAAERSGSIVTHPVVVPDGGVARFAWNWSHVPAPHALSVPRSTSCAPYVHGSTRIVSPHFACA